MVITASYGVESVVITTAEVTGYQVTPSPLTDGTQEVTITYSELGETCQTTYPVTVFEWGSETAVGDASWWAGLKTWAASASTSERSACVGKKKKVSLSTAVLGANQASMVCIGADQDGTSTLTFQTEGTLPTDTFFDDSSAAWIGSTARSQC